MPSRRTRPALIKTKVVPPPRPDLLVERARVERLVADLIERHRVVIVSATAGAGKTTAVLNAVQTLDRPLAWLAVDRTDVAPGRLVTYLEAALARACPEVAAVATDALAAGIPHAEAAGLLAETIGANEVVLVLDDLDRLGEDPAPWAVIDALVRYGPPGLHITMISRRDIPAVLCTVPHGPAAAVLHEHHLAFTPEEAAQALRQLGHHRSDPEAVVAATGGWVTGVLFDAWAASTQPAGGGGAEDPLDGYLSTELLGHLDPAERDFLVATSVLDEVTAERASALGQHRAGERLTRLRAAHLPVVWDGAGRVMRCHPRFREHLLARLDTWDPDEVRTIRVAHAHLLALDGHDEDAAEALLACRQPTLALESAERAIFSVIERLDFAVAERWLAALVGVAPSGASPLTTAELLLAIATDDYRRGLRVADQLAELGERESLARSSERAAALMASCYLASGRLQDAHAILNAAGDGPDVQTVRYTMRLYEQRTNGNDVRPEPSGGPLDGVLMYADYFSGRLSELAQPPSSSWARAVARPWQIAARSAIGAIDEALEVYESACEAGMLPVCLQGYVGPEVLIDAGRRDDARRAIEEGRRLARASGALDLALVNALTEAKLLLRLDRDAAAAQEVLGRVAHELDGHDWPFIRGPLEMWRGLALLLNGQDGEACAHLRCAVDTMVAADVVLELPMAAVYLAEGEWRAGDEDAADAAADLALATAGRLGSNHRLLQALADFPAVASRRIDAEPGGDSPWHQLGRALLARRDAVSRPLEGVVELGEFGHAVLIVDGAVVAPRIAKSVELLAFLIAHPDGAVSRDQLLDALFDGRTDNSTRSYLRQATYWVRKALPDGGLVVDRGRVQLSDGLAISSESSRFEQLLAQAARLGGADRLRLTLEALALFDRGEYLPTATSAWASERRALLTDQATGARADAAELAFSTGDYGQARTLGATALHADPLREGVWRLLMRVSGALGDSDGVVRSFRACEQALSEIGTSPSRSTRDLLERLRR